MQQAVAVAEQAVEAAEQQERASAESAQAAAAVSFAAEAQASKLAGTVKQMQVGSGLTCSWQTFNETQAWCVSGSLL